MPLVLEYEDVAKRPGMVPALTAEDIDVVIEYLCVKANQRKIFFLWRPFLKDPKDDLVFELAVSAQADIVTFNVGDFGGSETLGVRVLTPQTLLREIEELK